jgi:hypothetical protein
VSLKLTETDSGSKYSKIPAALNIEGSYSPTGDVVKGRPIYFASNLGTDNRGTYLFYWQNGFKWVIATQPPQGYSTFLEESAFIEEHALMTLTDSTFTADKINPEIPWEVREFATSLAGAECKDDSAKFLALHAKGDLADLLVDCNDAVYMGCQRPTVLSTCPSACGKCLGE